MHKGYKITREKCKRYFDISIGQIEVVDKPTEKFEAIKYCKRNAGIPLPVKNQFIMNEVRNVTNKCLNENNRTESRARFHSGLDCKNGIYKWFDGTEFDINNYDKKLLRLEYKKCNPIYLKPLDRFYVVQENRNLSFMCLKTSATTKSNFFWENIQTKDACIIGLSALSIILIILFIFSLCKIFDLKKKQELAKSHQLPNSINVNVISDTRLGVHHESENNLLLEPNHFNVNGQNFSAAKVSVKRAIYDTVYDVDDDADDVINDQVESYETCNDDSFCTEPETIVIGQQNHLARTISFNKGIYERADDGNTTPLYNTPEDEDIYAEPGITSCSRQDYSAPTISVNKAVDENVVDDKGNNHQNYNEEHFYTEPEIIYLNPHHYLTMKPITENSTDEVTDDKEDSFYYIDIKSTLKKLNDDVTNETCYATIEEFSDDVIYLTTDA